MSGRIRSALEGIEAGDALKASALAHVRHERQHRENITLSRLRLAVIAVCAAAALMIGGGYSVYAIPASYISIDINPSVELSLNRFDRVLSVAVYTGEITLPVGNLHLENKPYLDAIELLTESEIFQSYLAQGAELTITVASARGQHLVTGIKEEMTAVPYPIHCQVADPKAVREARAHSLSLGRYLVYQQLLQNGDGITPEECRRMSMDELSDRLARCLPPKGQGQQGNTRCHDQIASVPKGRSTSRRCA